MAKENQITVSCSVFVARPPETVWDFTQDYANRPKWDKSVLEAKVLQEASPRTVWLRMSGGTSLIFEYKLNDRPRKTTLAGRDIQSPWLEKCGGSWQYKSVGQGTEWEQTNTIALKGKWWLRLLLPLISASFKWQTRRAMLLTKRLMER